MDMHNLPAPIRRKVSKLPAVTQDVLKQRLKDAKPPIAYDEIIKAIAACRSVFEAKDWYDKATVFAEAARVVKDKRIFSQWRAAQKAALRQLGVIAEAMQPTTFGRPGHHNGRRKGANSYLREAGIPAKAAMVALQFSRMTDAEFNAALAREEPARVSARVALNRGTNLREIASAAYEQLVRGNGALTHMRTWMRAHDARLASEFTDSEKQKVKAIVIEMQEWLDELDQSMGVWGRAPDYSAQDRGVI